MNKNSPKKQTRDKKMARTTNDYRSRDWSVEKPRLEQQVEHVLDVADAEAKERVIGDKVTAPGRIRFGAYSVSLDGTYNIEDLKVLVGILRRANEEVRTIYCHGPAPGCSGPTGDNTADNNVEAEDQGEPENGKS